MSLPGFITKTSLSFDSCAYPSQARDRILRNAIVLGIKSEKTYYKCVEKGSDLTLEEALEIVQSEDFTQCQVEASKQQTQIRTETDVQKFQARQSPWKEAGTAKATVSRLRGEKKILFYVWYNTLASVQRLPSKEYKML